MYYCVSNAADVVCVELLLHDRSIVGATDLQARKKIIIFHFFVKLISFDLLMNIFEEKIREIKFFVYFSLQGWQEVHQACRNGLVAHLEQLLYYGAELNARNASGNTPLHVCAVNNQESCARTLLFRGADKNALNFAGQTPYQVRLEKKILQTVLLENSSQKSAI